jgi:hypothetical protein
MINNNLISCHSIVNSRKNIDEYYDYGSEIGK